jgi:hypothetical protein
MLELTYRKTLLILASLALAVAPVHSCQADSPSSAVAPELQRKALSVLRTAMKETKDFEKVHAAEALIWSGHPEGVKDFFLEEERTVGSKPLYRIGIWRALYRTNSDNPAVQQECLRKIVAVFADPKAEDRGTASETLGKIKYAGEGQSKLVLDVAEHGSDDMRLWAQWILANSGKAEDEARLAASLRSQETKDREFAAYALRHFAAIRPASLKALQDIAATELADSELRYYVLDALYTHLPVAEREPVKQEILAKYVAAGDTDRRYQACMSLANWPTADMIPLVEKLLDNKPADERIGAAYVLLRMGQPRDKADPNH